MQILVAEDRLRMAETLERSLRAEGHTVTLVRDGPTALETALHADFDVFVLDVMLPGIDGFEIMRRLRARGSTVATLMLTARDTTEDIIEGLDSGADDYLTKPFQLAVLCARVRALGRRSSEVAQGPVLSCGDLTLHPTTRSAARRSRTILLTRTEYALLELLMRNVGAVITQEKLIEYAWGHGSETDESTLYVFIGNLRRKIGMRGEPALIDTVRGMGYCMKSRSE